MIGDISDEFELQTQVERSLGHCLVKEGKVLLVVDEKKREMTSREILSLARWLLLHFVFYRFVVEEVHTCIQRSSYIPVTERTIEPSNDNIFSIMVVSFGVSTHFGRFERQKTIE